MQVLPGAGATLAALVLGCLSTAPGASLVELQNRAVFDLGCPYQQLFVYHLDVRTKVVTGCARRLIYVESCQDIRGESACTWVLNTPTFLQTQWPQWVVPQPVSPYIVAQQPGPMPPPPSAVRPQPSAPVDPLAGYGMPPRAGAGDGAVPGAQDEAPGRPFPTKLFGPDQGQTKPPEGTKPKPKPVPGKGDQNAPPDSKTPDGREISKDL